MSKQSGKIISGDRSLSLEIMHERSLRAASGLQSIGVGSEETIAVYMRNDFAFFEAAYAANRLGIHLVPVNWHFSGSEVAYILEDSKARALIVHADLLAPIRSYISKDLQLFVVETPPEIAEPYNCSQADCELNEGDCDWSQWLETFEPLPAEEVPAPGSMIYTSGTTGRPKGVRRQAPTAEELVEMSVMMNQVMDFSKDDIVALLTAPMYHATPNGFYRRAVEADATIILESKFNAERYLKLIDQYQVTHAYAVATMFVRLLKLPEAIRNQYDVSTLEVVIHGAAPTAPDIKRAMIKWFGPVLLEHYGSTELGAVVYCNSQDWLDHPGTVGKALNNVSIKILDADKGELAAGSIGEIYARFQYYPDFVYQNDTEKRSAMEHDGLWTAGDIGYMDEDGFLFLCDRKNDMVISGGVNIYPKEIENELLGMDGVYDCAVFGIPDEDFGEAIAAVIQPVEGQQLQAEQILEYLRDRIAKYMLPKHIEFRDTLPREDSGKIFKRKIRDTFWEGKGRTI